MYKGFSEGVVTLTMPSFCHKRFKAVILVSGVLFLAILGAEYGKKAVPEDTGIRIEEKDRRLTRTTTRTDFSLTRVGNFPMTVINGKNQTGFTEISGSAARLAEVLWNSRAEAERLEADRRSAMTEQGRATTDGRSEIGRLPILSGIATIPEVPSIPDIPVTPDLPVAPDIPNTPDIPTIPDVPTTPDMPAKPDSPSTPDDSTTSDVSTEPKDSEENVREENPGLLAVNGFLLDAQGWIVGIDEATFETDDGYLELPSESCTGIRAHAFDGCDVEITEIYVPGNITGMEAGAFSGLPYLEWLDVAEENPNFASLDGVIFDKSGSKLYAFPGARTGTYEPPATMTEIADYAMDPTGLSALEFRKYSNVTLGRSIFGAGNGAGIRIYINGEYLKEFEETFCGYDVEVVPYYP